MQRSCKYILSHLSKTLKLKLYKFIKDNVILPRVLKADTSQSDYTDITIEHLENFAKEGFRTLVLAYREISDEEYSVNHTKN